MAYTIYLSGETHTDWREQIIQGIENNGLNVEVLGPITNLNISENIGSEILGAEENNFWRDHKSAKINALRNNYYLGQADLIVVYFGEKYKQWDAAFDAGLAIGLGIPLIVMHEPELTHALKEVDAAALAVTQTTLQVVEILAYISQR
ncbi:MAG: YtoQ family protein [Methylobacter sp.]|nr:YtoQ family protein [Methylobacter sp.]MDP2099320.1 YtoQ family protein [Methylobacter sp.]MDP2428490.1 YtoQ family protein [Methylobacter sp.]MDP3055181.1 YtoQ family protein [Methylobacter sp.]MDP3363681.1 YtoQ family protein [Methylobacter sp.]